MSTLAEAVLRVDGTLREDDGDALAVEVLARDWRELVNLARDVRELEVQSEKLRAAAYAPKPFKWALLACSASKLDRPAPARDLYTGALFKLALEVAERQAETVLVLSAKHHVVQLDQVLEPYDERLPTDKHRRAHWGSIVVKALLRHFGVKNQADIKECTKAGEGVLCLAPQSYVEAISMYGKPAWSMPLKGLGIGEQKAALAKIRCTFGNGSAGAREFSSGKSALRLTGGGEESPEVPATSSTNDSANACTQELPCASQR